MTNAFNCFMGTEIDILVISNCLLRKKTKHVIKNGLKAQVRT